MQNYKGREATALQFWFYKIELRSITAHPPIAGRNMIYFLFLFREQSLPFPEILIIRGWSICSHMCYHIKMFQTFLLLFIFPHLNNKILCFFHYFNLLDESSDDSSTTTVNNNDNINESNEHFTLILLFFFSYKIHTHTQINK